MIKKYFILTTAVCVSLLFISWGYVGHQAVARIAETHLTPQARSAVKVLLGKETIVDVASWADEAVNQPDYKSTASWHYVNIEPGLTYNAFAAAVKSQTTPNVYSAIQSCENVLKDKTRSARQKAVALKFIVHLIGDAHQPMHVSRAEDKGGNTIQIKFNGSPTNLHSLWDSGLIGREGLKYAQMATSYDTATLSQIKQWQSDDLMRWLYESYAISSILYTEAEKSHELDDSYYKEHISIIQNRIEKAGIRLAGVLNELFKYANVKSLAVTLPEDTDVKAGNSFQKEPVKVVNLNELVNHIGNNVTVTGKVYGYKDFGGMVLVNVGAAYPESPLTVVLKGEARQIAATIEGKSITVTGMVIKFKEKPEIEVTDAKQVLISK